MGERDSALSRTGEYHLTNGGTNASMHEGPCVHGLSILKLSRSGRKQWRDMGYTHLVFAVDISKVIELGLNDVGYLFLGTVEAVEGVSLACTFHLEITPEVAEALDNLVALVRANITRV